MIVGLAAAFQPAWGIPCESVIGIQIRYPGSTQRVDLVPIADPDFDEKGFDQAQLTEVSQIVQKVFALFPNFAKPKRLEFGWKNRSGFRNSRIFFKREESSSTSTNSFVVSAYHLIAQLQFQAELRRRILLMLELPLNFFETYEVLRDEYLSLDRKILRTKDLKFTDVDHPLIQAYAATDNKIIEMQKRVHDQGIERLGFDPFSVLWDYDSKATKYQIFFADLAAVVLTGNLKAISELMTDSVWSTKRSFDPSLNPPYKIEEFTHDFFDPARIYLGSKLTDSLASGRQTLLATVFDIILSEILWLGKHPELQSDFVPKLMIPKRESDVQTLNKRLIQALKQI